MHSCEYWTAGKDQRRAHKWLQKMLEGDPELEVPFSEAEAQEWGNLGMKAAQSTLKCVCPPIFSQ